MNKYLEKIAAISNLEKGLDYDDSTNSFILDEETRKKLVRRHMDAEFRSHKRSGRDTFGVLGAGLGTVIGFSPLFKNRAVSVLAGAAAGYGIGALTGHALASGGNEQTVNSRGANEWTLSRKLASKHSRHIPDNFPAYPKFSYKD